MNFGILVTRRERKKKEENETLLWRTKVFFCEVGRRVTDHTGLYKQTITCAIQFFFDL